MGGPHPTAVHHEIFTDLPLIDAAVVGEGEDVILDWIAYKEKKKEFPRGVLERGKEFLTASPPDIHTLPMPARHLLPNHAYRYLFSSSSASIGRY